VRRTSIELVQTPRLTCERLRLEHVKELVPFLLDPRIVRTLWPRDEPPTEKDIAAGTAAKVEHWERYGFGLWLVRDRLTGAMVGRGGLQYTYAANLNEVEAAWAIVPERWGEGLATELAGAAIEVAFDALELPWIVALALRHNVASRRVMEKTGFSYQRDIDYAGLPHVLYERRRDASDAICAR
jgi:ribosomal-protein-alanine N-acetyltransferase